MQNTDRLFTCAIDVPFSMQNVRILAVETVCKSATALDGGVHRAHTNDAKSHGVHVFLIIGGPCCEDVWSKREEE